MSTSFETITKTFETREGYAEQYRALVRKIDIAEARTELYEDNKEKISFMVHWTNRLNMLRNELADMMLAEVLRNGVQITDIDTYYHLFRGRVLQVVVRKPDY